MIQARTCLPVFVNSFFYIMPGNVQLFSVILACAEVSSRMAFVVRTEAGLS